MKFSRKNKLLVAGFIVMLLICYSFAFSKTLSYYKEYENKKEVADNNQNDPRILDQLIRKEQQLDEALAQYIAVSGSSFQNELLAELTKQCRKQNLKIQDFKEPHVFNEDNVQVSSYQFSLEGSFNDMLLVLNALENNPSLGLIKHIAFEKQMNYKTNSYFLTSEVILQKVEPITKKQ
jgi:hypothetical protein